MRSLEDLVRDLDTHGIDMLHIDCADDLAVFEDIKAIRNFSNTPIDLHIISENPAAYFDKIRALEIEYVSIQYEKLISLPEIKNVAKTKFGLAITTLTDIAELSKENLTAFSFIMLMCTEPGKSGGVFQKENFQRIVALKNKYPSLKIQIDGGVNAEIAFVLKLLGIDSFVSGSYLMRQESLSAGMMSFFKTPTTDNFLIKDFFTPLSYLPVLKESELNFKKALQTIENYKQGFLLVIDEDNKLNGVISNADLRKGILKQIDNLENIEVNSMINRNPICIKESDTLGQLLQTVNGLNFIVLFLPVIDENNLLKGAVLLNNLTRG